MVLDLSLLAPWRSEVDEMNRGKKGRPFVYPRSFIKFVTFVHDVQGMTHRAAEGVLRVLGSVLDFEAPDYVTPWRREVVKDALSLLK